MAKTTPATSKVQARERARAARLRLDADRDARDNALEEAAADFFTSRTARDQIAAQLTTADLAMAGALTRLHALGETTTRIGALLDIDLRELRRLRDLTSPAPKAGE